MHLERMFQLKRVRSPAGTCTSFPWMVPPRLPRLPLLLLRSLRLSPPQIAPRTAPIGPPAYKRPGAFVPPRRRGEFFQSDPREDAVAAPHNGANPYQV